MRPKSGKYETIDLDFTGLPDDALAEIHRQAELYLTQTLAVATASDSRASTVASIFMGGSVALMAAVAAFVGQPKIIWQFVTPLTITTLGFFIAAVLCFDSVKSVDFYVAGYKPSKLLKAARDLNTLLTGSCEDLERRIKFNEDYLASASKKFNVAIRIATISVLIGGAVYLLYPYLKAFL